MRIRSLVAPAGLGAAALLAPLAVAPPVAGWTSRWSPSAAGAGRESGWSPILVGQIS